MLEDIGADEYKIEENEKEYILRISSTNNKINLNLSTRDNKQFKNYSGEFTLDDLRRINRVFLLTPTIYEAKEEFKKAIERKKIAISERDDYIHTVFYMMIGTDTSTLSVALPRDETPRIVRLEQNLNILKLGKDNLSDRLAVFEREADEIKRDLDKIQLGNNTLHQIADTIGQGIPDVSEILREYKANRQNPNYSSYQRGRNFGADGIDQPYSSAKYNNNDQPYSSAKYNNNDQPYSSAKFNNNQDNDQPYSSARLDKDKDQPYSSARLDKDKDQPYSSARFKKDKDKDQPYSSGRFNDNEDQPYTSTKFNNNNEDQPYTSTKINNNNEDKPYSSAKFNNNEDQPYSSAKFNNNNEDQPYSSVNYKGTQIDPIKESLNEQNRDSSVQNENIDQGNYNLDMNNLEVNPSVNSNQEDRFPNGIIKNIIKEPEEIEMVTNKIADKFPGSSYKLLYKGSRDGDGAAEFHNRCDDAEKTLVIVEDNYGNRFGGFTTQDWGGQYLQKKDDDAFIFSVDKNRVYDVIPDQNAIGCYPNFGPVFFGCQIRIYDNFLAKGGTTYKKGLNYRTTEDFELTNGKQNFGVRDIEVYEVETQS